MFLASESLRQISFIPGKWFIFWKDNTTPKGFCEDMRSVTTGFLYSSCMRKPYVVLSEM